MEDPEELVSVYRAAEVPEAHLVKSLLLDENIDAEVSEENEPFAGLAIVPADVLVRRRDLARAEAIVKRYDEKKIARAERADWTCPACGARVPGAFDECDVCGKSHAGQSDG
jgi:rubrerythrin